MTDSLSASRLQTRNFELGPENRLHSRWGHILMIVLIPAGILVWMRIVCWLLALVFPDQASLKEVFAEPGWLACATGFALVLYKFVSGRVQDDCGVTLTDDEIILTRRKNPIESESKPNGLRYPAHAVKGVDLIVDASGAAQAIRFRFPGGSTWVARDVLDFEGLVQCVTNRYAVRVQSAWHLRNFLVEHPAIATALVSGISLAVWICRRFLF